MKYEFVELSPLVKKAAKVDRAAAMAFFLMDQGVGIFGKWIGRMNAKDQRALFGQYLGKGEIIIDGEQEAVKMRVSIAFGQDWDYPVFLWWNELVAAEPLKIAA
jgi:hypothetical protein